MRNRWYKMHFMTWAPAEPGNFPITNFLRVSIAFFVSYFILFFCYSKLMVDFLTGAHVLKLVVEVFKRELVQTHRLQMVEKNVKEIWKIFVIQILAQVTIYFQIVYGLEKQTSPLKNIWCSFINCFKDKSILHTSSVDE